MNIKERNEKIMELTKQGLSRRQVAKLMGLSEGTVCGAVGRVQQQKGKLSFDERVALSQGE